MASNHHETRGPARVLKFDAELIDDPAEQERLNRTLRSPRDRSECGNDAPGKTTARGPEATSILERWTRLLAQLLRRGKGNDQP
jgi:hypothetical protein